MGRGWRGTYKHPFYSVLRNALSFDFTGSGWKSGCHGVVSGPQTGGCSKPVELHGIGVGVALARCPVNGGAAPNSRPSYGSSARARLWFGGPEIYSAPNAAFQLSDGVDTIGCACVAKLTSLGTCWIDSHASACAVHSRVEFIQLVGTLQCLHAGI